MRNILDTTNRLDGVARSFPALHAIVGAVACVGIRILLRLRHAYRQARKSKLSHTLSLNDTPDLSVLLIGLSRLTETYLESIAELAAGRVNVVGILGRQEDKVGRRVATCEVLGQYDQLDQVIEDLGVRGLQVDRIVVTVDPATLSEATRTQLFRIEDGGEIKVQFLTEDLGFTKAQSSAKVASNTKSQASFSLSPDDLDRLARRPYFKVKRVLEATAAAALLVLLSPLMALLALFVATTISPSVVFWQVRPGLRGMRFKVWKFCTMAPLRDSEGNRLTDEKRTSAAGSLLRRTRLDELPQLLNIVLGDMSFVGPRPLLPRDQDEAYVARLLVRPGLTGWAQVIGGRQISAEDKAALDVWYLRNASFRLDFEILVRTVYLVVFGEHENVRLIQQAWRELLRDGILQGELVTIARRRTEVAIDAVPAH